MNYKAIALDFDGVVVESVGIKNKAFHMLFERYSDHIEEITAYHLSHNATIRYEKFKYITEKILGQVYDEPTKQRLCNEYSQYVVDQILKCPFVGGAVEFLKAFQKQVPLFMVSVNPPKELDYLLKERGVRQYFREIYGYEWPKKDALIDIASKENIEPAEIIFIGDSPEDYQAAIDAGTQFLGRDSGKPFPPDMKRLFVDLAEIQQYILTSTLVK